MARAFFRCTATLVAQDGKKHAFTGGGMCRFKDGRFIEAWNQWDFLSLLASTGAVKPTAFLEAMQTQARLGIS